jgi:hypothetical protein
MTHTALGLLLMTPLVWFSLCVLILKYAGEEKDENTEISVVMGSVYTLALWGLYVIFC